MSGFAKQIPHSTIESIIFHKSNLLTAFYGITPRSGHYSNRFSQPATTRAARWFYWHVLSKQRSCPPYHGILINTGVGKPLSPIYTHMPRKHLGVPRNPIPTAATFCTREIPSWGLFRRSVGGGDRSRRASTSTP